MSQNHRVRLKWICWTFALAITMLLWGISVRWNVCYAGDFGFLVVTDGYLILPLSIQRTWGDWGWWVQSPWREPMDGYGSNLCPFLIGRVRQIGATGLYIPFATVYGILLYFPVRILARRTSSWLMFGLACLLFALLYYAYCPIFILRHQFKPMLLVTWIVIYLNLAFATCDALRHRRRNRIGICRGCGYDLTGNVSGVCPECGISVEAEINAMKRKDRGHPDAVR